MSTRSLPRNAAGGRQVTGLGAYVRENAETFGAGTLLDREAESILPPSRFARRDSCGGGWRLSITHLRSDPLPTGSYPTVWKRITRHEPQECDRDCARYYTIKPNHPTSANAHCRPVPCLPRATLAA